MPGTTLPYDQQAMIASLLARVERLERRINKLTEPKIQPDLWMLEIDDSTGA